MTPREQHEHRVLDALEAAKEWAMRGEYGIARRITTQALSDLDKLVKHAS